VFPKAALQRLLNDGCGFRVHRVPASWACFVVFLNRIGLAQAHQLFRTFLSRRMRVEAFPIQCHYCRPTNVVVESVCGPCSLLGLMSRTLPGKGFRGDSL